MTTRKTGLRILHTSDWHLGRTLCGQKRSDEHNRFFTWLIDTICQEQVDVLLVAGDVFNTSTPSNRAQALYYSFLCRVADSACRHVVVIGGNHDSPSFLEAPRELLRTLNIYVVGAAPERLEDEVIILNDTEGSPELIVCAVPYLRDHDIRRAEPGESIEDKERKLTEGIGEHYARVVALAEQKRGELDADIPIFAMGHLFTAGGITVEGDGVRKLFVGSLAHVSTGIFPRSLAYLALGHLHIPQKVNGSELMRYSGSPLPMGFGGAWQEKSVCLVEFSGGKVEVELLEIPVFQSLERVAGTWDKIATRIRELEKAKSEAWLEVVYEGDEVIGDLRQRLEEEVSGSGMDILRVKNKYIVNQVLEREYPEETLAELDVEKVFERRLSVEEMPKEQREVLRCAYREIVKSLEEEDTLAE